MSAKLKTFTVEFSWLLPLYVHQQIEAPNLAAAITQAENMGLDDKIDFDRQKECWDDSTEVRFTGLWDGKPYDTPSLLPDELATQKTFALAKEVAASAKLIPDPRRVVIVAHTNSSNPRAERWYGLRIACDFDDGTGLIPLSWPKGVQEGSPNRLAHWVQERNRIAERLHLQIARGVWRDKGPTGMELIGSPKA